MSELVSDLIKLGYLRSSPDPHDRRAKLITLTKRGRRAVEAALAAFDAMDRALVARMGIQQLRTLRRTFLRVLDTSLVPSTVGSDKEAPE